MKYTYLYIYLYCTLYTYTDIRVNRARRVKNNDDGEIIVH